MTAALTASVLSAPSPALELPEIVVTAEFRDINLQDQPASASILSGDDIQQRAAQHLEEILNIAPNVNFASGASRARYYQVRGIGERSQFQAPLNPSVGFMVDGIDFSGLGTAGTLFDVAQVEVLRGPQGTLHGANALAGLISIRTGQPEKEPRLTLHATAADYDTLSAGIIGSGPLIADTLLYRVAINTYRSDGFIDNDYLRSDDTNNRRETVARGKLRWLGSDTSSLDIIAMYVDIDNGYDAFSLDNTRHTLSDEPGQDSQESSALGLNWHRELRGMDLQANLNIASTDSDYGYDEDWSFVGIAPGWEYSSVDQYLRERDSQSAELRLLSNDQSRLFNGNTDWVAGFYYLGNKENLDRRYTYLEQDFRSSYDTSTFALFGQIDSRLTDKTTLITGLRFERRQTDYSDNSGVASDPDNNLWGGRIALEHTISDATMVYGSISRGYRANGVNAEILASMDTTDNATTLNQLKHLQTYDEEYLLNYEAGLKGRYLDNRLRVRLALFYMDRRDQQIKSSLVVPRSDGSTAFINYTSNAASGNNYGTELEVDWLATANLTLYANIGLLRTQFDDHVNRDGEDLSGRDQAHAPGYQFAVGGRLDFGAGLYARLDLEGKDDFYFSDRHSVKSSAYEILHMRIGYDTSQWSFALWGRNLTDEDYYVRGFGSFGNDPRKQYITEPYYQFGDPRTIGVSASFSF
ncbi:MAG: TonB-dependent receptor [Halieaceae bacterium]|nr:TonB-dependent receptor [Halieaceae bacterium]